jgi:hypothetical protein
MIWAKDLIAPCLVVGRPIPIQWRRVRHRLDAPPGTSGGEIKAERLAPCFVSQVYRATSMSDRAALLLRNQPSIGTEVRASPKSRRNYPIISMRYSVLRADDLPYKLSNIAASPSFSSGISSAKSSVMPASIGAQNALH